jgi:hypothetical protein
MKANYSNPAEDKDYNRIDNIINRAKGDSAKVLQHASNMAKSIKDPSKAWRRFNAALECTDSRIPASIREGMARIFWVKATAL